MRRHRHLIAAIAAALLSSALAPSAAWAHEIFYSGRAIGVEGTATIAGAQKKVLLAANYMSCQGLPKDETVSSLTNPSPLKVSVKTVTTYTLGRDNVSTAEAATSSAYLEVPGLVLNSSALSAEARVDCDPATLKQNRTGSTTVGSLRVNGEGFAITGAPNQVIEIPGVATIIVNEQIKYKREFRATALRVKLLDPDYPINGEVAFSHVRAKLECLAQATPTT